MRPRTRITWGYPTIFALALNTRYPVLLHHRLFSYQGADFQSQPWKWIDGMRRVRQIAGRRRVCLVADAEADDQQGRVQNPSLLWQEAAENRPEPIARTTRERLVEVWLPRRRTWKRAKLQTLAARLRGRATCAAVFTHAGRTIPVQVVVGMRLPGQDGKLMAILRYWWNRTSGSSGFHQRPAMAAQSSQGARRIQEPV